MLYRWTLGITIVAIVVLAVGCGGGRSGPRAPQAVQQVRPAASSEAVHPAQGQYLGDMDGDGDPTIIDAMTILSFAVRLATPTAAEQQLADVDGSGSIDIIDAMTVLGCAVRLIDWPIGGGDGPVEGGYEFVMAWGSKGTGDGEFDHVRGVAVDAAGNVYVTDDLNHRVQKFTSDGVFLGWWGRGGHWYWDNIGWVWADESTGWHGPGSGQVGNVGGGDGQFHQPTGIAVDAAGNVYVTDSDRIQKFTSGGTLLGWWGRGVYRDYSGFWVGEGTTGWHGPGSGQVSDWGSGDSQFDGTWGVAVDVVGNVYGADVGNHRIQKFTSDGTFLTKWGSEGAGDDQFYYPEAIAVDAAGNVYVGDYYARIQKFTSDGTFLTKWDLGSSALAVDAAGNVYVVGGHCIQKFTSDGTFLTKWGSYGTGDGQFGNAWGIAVDDHGNVYLADYNNHRIQKFRPVGP